MLHRLPLALALLPLFAPGLDEVSIEHRAGLTYEMRMTRTMSMRLGEASMRVDGVEYPESLVRGASPDRDDVETVVLRDEVREVSDGRPVRVAREFAELGIRRTVADETTEHAGALEGMTLVIARGAEGGVEARLEDGAEETVDDAYLAGHAIEHDVWRFLPAEPVEPGDSWSPDDDAVKALLLTPGPQYYGTDRIAELPVLLAEAAEIEAVVTLLDRVTLDDVECHRLELRVEMRADLTRIPGEFASGDLAPEGTVRVESLHRGELWIAAERRFPRRFEVESTWNLGVEMDLSQDGAEVRVEMDFTAKNTSAREWEILD